MMSDESQDEIYDTPDDAKQVLAEMNSVQQQQQHHTIDSANGMHIIA